MAHSQILTPNTNSKFNLRGGDRGSGGFKKTRSCVIAACLLAKAKLTKTCKSVNKNLFPITFNHIDSTDKDSSCVV